MGLVKGGFLRLLQTVLYTIAFCCAAVILGIYSYFLASHTHNNYTIPTWQKAVEGLSGAAVLYTIFAVVLTCCLAGIAFFSFLAILLDVLFIGAMVAIAVLTRHGASSCNGFVRTPLGNGNARDSSLGSPSLHTACRLNTAAFAVSIIGAFIFIITALMQVLLTRHHKKEKRYGPSPDNNYTSGYGKRKFWQRKPKTAAGTRDAEMATAGAGAGGLAAGHRDMRPSYETGTTVGNGQAFASHDKVETTPAATHGGYYTQPQGTGVNPYGYENTTRTAAHPTAGTNY